MSDQNLDSNSSDSKNQNIRTGLSGLLTKATITSPLTPLLLITALIFGFIALLTIPREEEPQISVPMIDLHVNANGLKAEDAVELITKPLEEIVKSANGVEHVYSQTQDDGAVVTARFFVGTRAEDAILRVREKVESNLDHIPVGIQPPLIVGRGIDDVAIVVVTLSPKNNAADAWGNKELYALADEIKSDLSKVEDTGYSYMVGGASPQIRIEPDPERLAQYGVTLPQLIQKLKGSNFTFSPGYVRDNSQQKSIIVGQTMEGVPDIGLLQLLTYDGRPVYIKDVADITVDDTPKEQQVWTVQKNTANEERGATWQKPVPAISIAFAKRAGANAVVVSDKILERLDYLKTTQIPKDINVSITRNYGQTANEKANELLFHLGLATISIVLLIGFSIGWKEAFVTLVIIPVTIMLTLFAAKTMGYTINRVSLFALIFSIGILVDDAIVVIENIARHWGMKDGRSKIESAIAAVAEVGNPTIVATMTVIAALLPMLFVSGLMGPYMAPIPVNASFAMLFSFFVAVTITPWLMIKVSKSKWLSFLNKHDHHEHNEGKLGRLYRKFATPVIATKESALKFLVIVGAVTILSMLLFVTRNVTVKLLPFDNKSELSIVADLPEGSTLEDTEKTLLDAMAVVKKLPEVESAQIYAGTAAPFNFNGLVRHYYMRQSSELGELQINLLPKHERARSSHEIALDLRQKLDQAKIDKRAFLKIIEVPPGPPVMATMVAEIYGKNATERLHTSEMVKSIFSKVPYMVDIDDSYGIPKPRLKIEIDQDRLEYYGLSQDDVYTAIQMVFGGVPIGYSHRGDGHNPLSITMQLSKPNLKWSDRLATTPVGTYTSNGKTTLVELGDIVRVSEENGSRTIFRHNGRFADMVMAELAGAFEAPVYAILDVNKILKDSQSRGKNDLSVFYHAVPKDETKASLLWDGEWEITYVTFRDMGIAFGVALLGIYVLVVAQFKSFKLPLVILTPVPLTFIGIILGHWLFNAPFTATSMIGFIALAGIIVRNSILLVDFIRHAKTGDRPLRDVLLEAGAVRFRPILLTALAAMIGAITILTDPIFQGLAISLLFGLASSTLLTVLVIPAIYIVLRDDHIVLEKGEF